MMLRLRFVVGVRLSANCLCRVLSVWIKDWCFMPSSFAARDTLPSASSKARSMNLASNS